MNVKSAIFRRLGIQSKADIRFMLDDGLVLAWDSLARLREPWTFSAELKAALARNNSQHNRFKGKRCWIVGNGPSIGRQDLTLLENEITFVVNRFIHHEQAEAINPTFYVIVDPKFGAGTWGADFVNQVEERLPNVEMIIGFDGEKFLNARGLLVAHRRHVIRPNQLFCFGYPYEIDLTRGIPGMDNVTKCAISTAVYMGFSEINLLGIDGNGLLISADSHFYGHVPGPETQEGLERALASASMSMRSWRSITGYLGHRGVELVSRNPESVMTSLPYRPYEEAFERGDP